MDPVDYNFAHSINLFASTSATGEVLEARDFILSNTLAPIADFNQAMLKMPRHKPQRTLDRVLDYYARAKVPFRLHVPIDDAAVNDELLSRGFARVADVPCMTFDGVHCGAPAVANLEIREVDDAAGLADFQRLAFESFGFPVEIAPLALTEELAALPQVAMFVGRIDGVAACCSALIRTGDIAGVYWVGTLAAHRGLGLGAAITAHAVNTGLARGCARACLQASVMGAPVYRRIGFAHTRSYLRFDFTAG